MMALNDRMSEALSERLAREGAFKLSLRLGGSLERDVKDIAPAIRAALDEAAKLARSRADELRAEAGAHFAAKDFMAERMFLLAASEVTRLAAAIEALEGAP